MRGGTAGHYNTPEFKSADDLRWMDDARCKGVDPKLIESGLPNGTNRPSRPATRRNYSKQEAAIIYGYCNVCPVKQECRDYSFSTYPDPFAGLVAGGLTFREREQMRRTRPRL